MNTKLDALEYLNQVYVLEKIDTDFYRTNLKLDESRQQLVYLMLYEDKVHVFSSFGNEQEISANVAIKNTATTIYGVKLFAGSWILSNVEWLENLHPHQLDNSIQGIAVAADLIELKFKFEDNL